jgi:hypothetical protein
MKKYTYHYPEFSDAHMEPEAKDCEQFYLASDVDAQIEYLGETLRGVMMSEDALKAHIARQDAKIEKLDNALNLIRDGCADDECASPLTKEDMQQIANNVLMDSVNK